MDNTKLQPLHAPYLAQTRTFRIQQRFKDYSILKGSNGQNEVAAPAGTTPGPNTHFALAFPWNSVNESQPAALHFALTFPWNFVNERQPEAQTRTF